jgi:hypothetical protein
LFITNASYECAFPNYLGEPSARYFRAFDLSTRQPWFLVTFSKVEGRLAFAHTMACASDRDLVLVLRGSSRDVVSLQQVVANRGGMLAWRVRDVTSVWQAEDPVTGVIAVRLECADGETIVSPMTDPSTTGWALVATVSSASVRRSRRR